MLRQDHDRAPRPTRMQELGRELRHLDIATRWPSRVEHTACVPIVFPLTDAQISLIVGHDRRKRMRTRDGLVIGKAYVPMWTVPRAGRAA